MNFADLTLIDNVSAYVKATQTLYLENISIIKQNHADLELRTNDQENNEALKRAEKRTILLPLL